MKLNKNLFDFKDLLHNRIILYSFLLISLFHLFFYVNTGDYRSVATFILIGFLTSFFSKNMIVVMVFALTITHVLKFGVKSVSEGLTNKESLEEGEEEEKEEGEEGEDEKGEKKVVKDLEEKGTSKKGTTESMKGATEPMKELEAMQNAIMEKMKELEPLVTKAEQFVEKYQEKFKGSK
jgi:hypothetical protein